MIVVTTERNSQIQARSDQTHAEITLPTSISPSTIKAVDRGEKKLQTLWKEHVAHDPDGLPIGRPRELVGTVTLIRVEVLYVADLTLEIASACGYKTSQDLREKWTDRHPRSPRAAIVWFALGDWRDRDVFMNWTGRAGGDYTANARRAMDSDAPVLSREEIDALSKVNRQKDDVRRAQASAALAAETPSERLKRVKRETERLGDEARRAIRQEIRIITQRLERAERRNPS